MAIVSQESFLFDTTIRENLLAARPSASDVEIEAAARAAEAHAFIDSLPEKEEFRERIPMGRYGHVDEVSELISLLASDRAAYITGQNIRIDGGITRHV